MIRLNKSAAPNILTQNATAWTNTLLAAIAHGAQPPSALATKYRHPEVKAALKTETSGKCAYCESKLLHIHHGDVEHIYPKSLAPSRTFEWQNLTLACEICNQNKSNKDPYLTHIIDPYLVGPEAHLIFVGPFVYPRGTAAGISTEAILDLNRAELCERRKEHLDKVMSILATVLRLDLPYEARKAIYEDLIANEGASSAEYSAMNKAAIDHVMPSPPTPAENAE